MQVELILFILGVAVVTAGCLVPASWLPALPNDKLLHFLAYGGLGMLAGRIAYTKIELTVWLAGLLIAGLLIEGLQKWVPGRRFCWRDLAANAAGILVAPLCARAVIGL
jgi:VanZ family protein